MKSFGSQPPKEEQLQLQPLPPESKPNSPRRGAIDRTLSSGPSKPLAADLENPADTEDRLRNKTLPQWFLGAGCAIDLLAKCLFYGFNVGTYYFWTGLLTNTIILAVATLIIVMWKKVKLGPAALAVIKLAGVMAVMAAAEDLLPNVPLLGISIIYMLILFVVFCTAIRMLFDVEDDDAYAWAILFVVLGILWQSRFFIREITALLHMILQTIAGRR
jgi:hypothetical protein